MAAKLRAVFDDPVSITADVLHEGPAPELAGDGWREQRARYLADAGYAEFADARQALGAWDESIEQAADHDEVVLWFEHDLYDQLLLVRTLALIGALHGPLRPRRLSLICVNAYLGYLSPAQLHTLWPTRAPVTDAQLAIAHRAWYAFRQPDPAGLLMARAQLKADYCLPMPFLGDALERFFEEYPSTTNGLSRTADTTLRVLDEVPVLSGTELFRRIQIREARFFLGDLSHFHLVTRMAQARVPLVDAVNADGRNHPGSRQISITDVGRAVLRGDRDAVHLNGLDEWRGGVHLSGQEASWRWDARRKTLISCT